MGGVQLLRQSPAVRCLEELCLDGALLDEQAGLQLLHAIRAGGITTLTVRRQAAICAWFQWTADSNRRKFNSDSHLLMDPLSRC